MELSLFDLETLGSDLSDLSRTKVSSASSFIAKLDPSEMGREWDDMVFFVLYSLESLEQLDEAISKQKSCRDLEMRWS